MGYRLRVFINFLSQRSFAIASTFILGLSLLLPALSLAQANPNTSPSTGKRVALVIGNSAYAEGPLRNPVNDARLMERTLRELGFQVAKLENANFQRMQRALVAFGSRAQGADVALIFFAGHGMQADGENYLIPVGARIDKEADLAAEALTSSAMLRQVESSGAKVSLVVLDACRNNPFQAKTRSSVRGLARVDVPTGSIVAYAAQANAVADDGEGNNGLYTGHLVKFMRQPGMDIKQVFEQTAIAVERDSKGRQRPREDTGLRGNFVLNGKGVAQASALASNAPPIPESDPDEERWAYESARKLASVESYERFLTEFPDGNFSSNARMVLLALKPMGSRIGAADSTPAPRPAAPAPSSVKVAAGAPIRDCPNCPQIVPIPAGTLQMGSPATEPGRAEDEGPVRRVNIKAFHMGRTEVTQGQWRSVMGTSPSQSKACGDECPVESISWTDAQSYVKKLSDLTGKPYALPSEAQWEYACRAGQALSGCGAADIDAHAWFEANSTREVHRVAEKLPNPFGLYDLSGNVWEWTQDCWNPSYLGAPTDGSAWTSGDCSQRVSRGGSSADSLAYMRAAVRDTDDLGKKFNFLGFRVVRLNP